MALPPSASGPDGLIARIARDLRTPLNDILGYVELMEAKVHGDLPPAYDPFVGAMVSSGDTLRKTLDTIGDLALLRAAATGQDHPLSLVELSPDMSVVLIDGRIDYINAAGLRMLGLPSREVARGRPFVTFLHQDWRSLADDGFASLCEEQGRVPLRMLDALGRRLDLELSAVPIQATAEASPLDPEGRGVWLLLVGRDISGMVAATVAVRSREARIRAIMDSVQDGILTIDEAGRIETCNVAAARMLGYDPGSLVSVLVESLIKMPRQLADGAPGGLTLPDGGVLPLGGAGVEVVGRHRDGSALPLHLIAQEAVVGGQRLFAGTLRNLSRERELAARAERAERYDPLTSLPNRREFVSLLDAAIARGAGPFHIIVMEISGLTAVNETHGFDAGNRILLDVAACVRDLVDAEWPCARVAGGSFGFAVPANDTSSPDAMLFSLQDNLSQAVTTAQHGDMRVASRLGSAAWPDHGQAGRDLLRRAEIALHHAREGGRERPCRIYEKSMAVALNERVSLERSIRVALEDKQFYLDYQPQFNLETGAIVGVEALLRWNHPEIGLISPARFIPVAEDSDLILAIGTFALEEACAQAARWMAEGIDPPRMGVNLSARQFADPDLHDRVVRALQDSRLPARKLELELTEGLLMQSANHTLRVLRGFADMGISIAVDDFGTGYSSLAYLKRFPVSTLKIDRAFVTDVHTNSDDQAIAGAIVSLAESLGLSTIAEGIEVPEQAAVLRAMGCQEVQGYLFARPMAPDKVVELLKQKHHDRRIAEEIKP